MTTPLDIQVLRQLPELAAAQQLVAMTRVELWAAAQQLVAMTRVELWAAAQQLQLRPKTRASREDLITAILEATHPTKARQQEPAQQYQQESLI